MKTIKLSNRDDPDLKMHLTSFFENNLQPLIDSLF